MELKDILKIRRKELNLTLEDVAKHIGVGKATVQRWESGNIGDPRRDKIEKLAEILEISPVTLVRGNWEPEKPAAFPTLFKDSPTPKTKKVPLLGTIACGTPIFAEENIEDMIPLPVAIKADFCLVCKGDSMIDANIYDGDLVFIRKQDDVDSGQIAAVLIGEDATLKRVIKHPGGLVELRAENPDFPSIYPNEDEEVRIIGKAVDYLTKVR